MQIALADGTQVRGDIIVRAVQRFDLTPVPSTLELVLRYDDSADARITYGTTLIAGSSSDQYEVVKIRKTFTDVTQRQGEEPQQAREVIAFLKSCAPLTRPMPRAVIKERRTLGEIYRSCGASCRVTTDIETVRFACYMGHVPTFGIAQLLQEEAAAPVWSNRGALAFVRLQDLFSGLPVDALASEATKVVNSPFLEQHEIPYAWSTVDNGSVVFGRRDAPRPAVYLPRTAERVLNNITKCLVVRRQVASAQFAGHIRAGDGIDVAGVRHVVVTAAHAWQAGSDGGGMEQSTSLWLGQLSTR